MDGIDGIRGAAFSALPGRARLERTAQELEAVVITQIMKTMRESVPDGGLFEKSAANDIFKSMFDSELSRVVARKSPFGLADAIVKEYQDQVQKSDPPAETKSDPAAGANGGPGPASAERRSWRI